MEEEAFVERVVSSLEYAASVSERLLQNPTALRQLLAYRQIARKLREDPVFFAVLMCGDKWLVNAEGHKNLLRDMSLRQVAACGRGWGKSLVLSRKNLWLVYTKPNVESLIISSTQRQSMIMFDYCYSTILRNPLMRQALARPGTTRTVIRLKPPLNGKIVALPCSPYKLRGYHPDWVFLDEATIIPSEMITGEIMMMLTKPNAGLVLAGTPLAFNHVFRRAFLDNKRYSVHHYPSYASPLVSQEQLMEWREMMTREEWLREVEALWVETANAFFPIDLIINCIDPTLRNSDVSNAYIDDMEKADVTRLKGRYYAGLDLGKQVDYSVFAVVQHLDTGEVRLIHKRQFPLGTPYPNVIAYVARAHQIFKLQGINVDKTGVGDAITDELTALGLPNVEGIFFTDAEKENMLNTLKLLMEKKQLKIPSDDAQLIAQISEQQYEYLKPKTAQERIHLKFSHPPGRHDDQLYALALACYAARQAKPQKPAAFTFD